MREYLKWRGDLSFAAVPLGEIDALILSQLAYLHFRDALGSAAVPLYAAARLVESIPRESGNAQVVMDRHMLLSQAAACERFANLTVAFSDDRFDASREMQFAAVTFSLPNGAHAVAYRGTDATVVGWRENFNMSFACPVPSQTEAVRYLTEVAGQTAGALYLCGHSKGGNLAMYAAAQCTAARQRIAGIYLFDAPGVNAETAEGTGYRAALDKVHCYVPQTSIIGQLMRVPENCTVVHSSATGMGQHHVFTWGLDGPRFATLPGLDSASRLVKATVDDFLTDSTPDMRQRFVETLFAVLGAVNTHTLGEMAERWTDTAGALWNALRGLDATTRRAVTAVVSTLAASGVESAIKWIGMDREPTERANAEKEQPSLPEA